MTEHENSWLGVLNNDTKQVADRDNELSDDDFFNSFKEVTTDDTMEPWAWTKGQQEGIDRISKFLSDPKEFTFLLQGRAGTGKTTVLGEALGKMKNLSGTIGCTISHVAKEVLSKSVPRSHTFAAAAGLKQSTSKDGVVTFKPDKWADNIPMKTAKILVADEASMFDRKIIQLIEEIAPSNCKVIFVGDRHQLPPIITETKKPAFNVSPIFKSGYPTYELTENQRSGETNPIITKINNYADAIDIILDDKDHAKAISQLMTEKENQLVDDRGFFHENDYSKLLQWIVEKIKENPDPKFAKIVTYRNWTRQNINKTIREMLYGEDCDQVVVGEYLVAMDTYRQSEKIMFYNSEYVKVYNVRKGIIKVPELILENGRWRTNPINSTDIQVLYLNIGKDFEVPIVAREAYPVYNRYEGSLKERAMQTREPMDWRDLYSFKEKFAPLEYSHAITTYKCQGETYEFCAVHQTDIQMTQKIDTLTKLQAMYTASSRPTEQLLIYNGDLTR